MWSCSPLSVTVSLGNVLKQKNLKDEFSGKLEKAGTRNCARGGQRHPHVPSCYGPSWGCNCTLGLIPKFPLPRSKRFFGGSCHGGVQSRSRGQSALVSVNLLHVIQCVTYLVCFISLLESLVKNQCQSHMDPRSFLSFFGNAAITPCSLIKYQTGTFLSLYWVNIYLRAAHGCVQELFW